MALLVGTSLTALLGLVYSVYAARALGPELAADFFAAVAFVSFLQVALGPINGTVSRFTAAYASAGEVGRARVLCREVGRRVAAWGVLGLIGGALLAGPIQTILKLENGWLLWVAYIAVYATLLLSVARGALRGMQRFGHYNINTVFEALLRLVIGVAALSMFPLGALAAFSAFFVSILFTLALSLLQLRGIWRNVEPMPVNGREVRRFTGAMFLLMLTASGFQNVDMLFVKHYFDASEAGVYGAVFKLTGSISVLVTAFNTQLLPLITSLSERGRNVVKPLALLLLYFGMAAALPLALFGIWSSEIMVALYDQAYVEGSSWLFSLTLSRVLACLSLMLALAGAAMNRFRFLYVYLPGLGLQVAVLLFRHATISEVITILIVTNAAVLLAMLIEGASMVRRSRAVRDQPDLSTESNL